MRDRRPSVAKPSAALTRRELEVLELAAQGLTNDAIANELSVTVHSIKFHLASIYRKLGVGNRTQAATAYLRSTVEAGQGSRVERTVG